MNVQYNEYLLSIQNINHAVDSLLFVGYQFSWIWWVQENHEFRCLMNNAFSKGMNANCAKTTNLNIHEYASFLQSTKIGIHENK